MASDIDRLAALDFWPGQPTIEPLTGGLTNRNYAIACAGKRFVARIGGDVPQHGVDRAVDIAVSRVAGEAGLSPRMLYAEPDLMILDHVTGRTLAAGDFEDGWIATDVLHLLERIGTLTPDIEMPERDAAAVLVPYVFGLRRAPGWIQSIAETYADEIATLRASRFTTLSHGDMHPGNIVHDGQRAWLVDWEYAGLAHPLADVASLAVNAGVSSLVAFSWARRILPDMDSTHFAELRLGAALRDLFWGLTQAMVDPAFGESDYIAINRERVARIKADG